MQSKNGTREMLDQSYVHGASKKQLLGETLGANFDAAIEKWGDREALVVGHQNIRWTYRDLAREVDDFAAGLLALGLETGDRIGIWSPNNSEWVVAQYATAKIGLILVNIKDWVKFIKYHLMEIILKYLLIIIHLRMIFLI